MVVVFVVVVFVIVVGVFVVVGIVFVIVIEVFVVVFIVLIVVFVVFIIGVIVLGIVFVVVFVVVVVGFVVMVFFVIVFDVVVICCGVFVDVCGWTFIVLNFIVWFLVIIRFFVWGLNIWVLNIGLIEIFRWVLLWGFIIWVIWLVVGCRIISFIILLLFMVFVLFVGVGFWGLVVVEFLEDKVIVVFGVIDFGVFFIKGEILDKRINFLVWGLIIWLFVILFCMIFKSFLLWIFITWVMILVIGLRIILFFIISSCLEFVFFGVFFILLVFGWSVFVWGLVIVWSGNLVDFGVVVGGWFVVCFLGVVLLLMLLNNRSGLFSIKLIKFVLVLLSFFGENLNGNCFVRIYIFVWI